MKPITARALAPDHPAVARLSVAIAELLAAAALASEATPPDALVAISELGEAQRELRRRIRKGELPAVKLGRAWWIRRSDLASLATPQEASVTTAQDAAARTPEAAYVRLVGARRTA